VVEKISEERRDGFNPSNSCVGWSVCLFCKLETPSKILCFFCLLLKQGQAFG
jgi:hypothetical protein